MLNDRDLEKYDYISFMDKMMNRHGGDSDDVVDGNGYVVESEYVNGS